jgi:hypothetical protein
MARSCNLSNAILPDTTSTIQGSVSCHKSLDHSDNLLRTPFVPEDVENQQKSDQSREEDSSTYDDSNFNNTSTRSSLSSNTSSIPPRLK